MAKKTSKLVSDKFLEEERERKLREKMKGLKAAAQEREAEGIAKIVDLPYVNLKGFPIEREAMLLVSEQKARESESIPFYAKENVIRLGIVNPANPKTKEVIKFFRGKGYELSLFIISKISFNYALNFYRQILIPKKAIEKVEVKKEALEKTKETIKSLADLRVLIRKVSTTEVINVIFAGALLSQASDIHLEPEEEEIALRFRIDGVLQNIARLPRTSYPKILSRVKYLARLKINVTEVPQDGRFTITSDSKEIDIRVSTLPTGYGETIVMRLLGVGAVGLKLKDLGLRERELKILEEEIEKPNGMILTTGPTGSGKTTTLYACLNQIKSPETKIITLENPIEYRLEGISQTQIDPEAGMTFARGLRAILRQDPDVVMVGEIRDLETAEIASQAALTGHIVFSTLHTNDAAGAIPRLINIGVRPYVIGPALSAIIGQRLVRKLCNFCKVSYTPDKDLIFELKRKLGKFYPKKGVKKLYKAREGGCAKCHETGYSGRVGAYEVFQIDEKIEDLINQRAAALDIFRTAQAQGMMSMQQDGFLKVIEGVTDIEEVKRITG
jgi:type II secretory ATPase GspE/PulE/Tfp pilus assembly ATPase PilB-like protein